MGSRFVIVGLLLLCGVNTFFAQDQTADKYLLENVNLKARLVDRGGQQLISLNPTIRKGLVDWKFRRRFEYILYNRTDYKDAKFENAYPDTAKIDSLYQEHILGNKTAFNYLKAFYQAIKSKVQRDQPIYTQQDLMDIGSRFFLVTGKRGENLLDWRVCIGLNGHEDHNLTEDYTLLEAFCFEAIFENMRADNGKEFNFMDKFLEHIKEVEVDPAFDDANFLAKARAALFLRMQQEKTLQNTLLKYYRENAEQLPFTIE